MQALTVGFSQSKMAFTAESPIKNQIPLTLAEPSSALLCRPTLQLLLAHDILNTTDLTFTLEGMDDWSLRSYLYFAF